MDDRGMDLWRWLLSPEGAALRERAAAADPAEVSDVARLRKQFAADQVRAAIALAEARRKAAAKFGTPAALAADPEGVEQASSSAVARHKAARFARIVSGGRVIDLCSGIGGDAMALAEAGMRPVAIDRDPLRAWMSRANAHCPAAAADAGRVNVAGHFFHIDPARRTEGGRVWRLADYQPGPDVLAKLSGAARGGAVKLSPGIDLGELEEAGLTGEVEFISEAGRLVQAVLWTGELAEVERRATRLPGTGESPAELAGEPGEPPIIGELAEHVYTVDPAAERAELLGELCERTGLEAVHPRLGLLSGGKVVDSPWLTRFELVERLPWRVKRVKRWLAAHGAGIVEVKTRGGAVDPDAAQAELRGSGEKPFTVFVLRWGRQKVALIARRPERG